MSVEVEEALGIDDFWHDPMAAEATVPKLVLLNEVQQTEFVQHCERDELSLHGITDLCHHLRVRV